LARTLLNDLYSVSVHYANCVIAGLISGAGPGSNPGRGAKLGQARML